MDCDRESCLVQWVERFAHVCYEDFSLETIEAAKACLLDMLECAYACDVCDSRITSAFQSVEPSNDGICMLWGTGLRANAADAAFYNAARCALSYRNSLHRESGTHPVEIAAAAAISAGQKCGAPPTRVLSAIICGIDAITDLGRMWKKARIPSANRVTALSASMGAAVAAAKAFDLNVREIASAVSFAAHTASGNNQWGNDGTGEDVFQAGWGARNGYQAAWLARCGAVGTPYILEGTAGLLATMNVDLSCVNVLFENAVGQAVTKIESKPIDGCLMVQTPAQLLCGLLARDRVETQDIKNIRIFVSRQALDQAGCDSMNVFGLVQAKMNIRYVVSSVLHGNLPQEIVWKPPYSESVLEVMKRCDLLEDEAYTKRFPAHVASGIEIELNNGSTLKHELMDFMPLTKEQLRERFKHTVEKNRSRQEAVQIEETVTKWETYRKIKDIVSMWC